MNRHPSLSSSRLLGTLVVMATLASIIGCSKDPEVAKREFVKSGDAFVAERKFDEAIIEYRNAVQQDPRFAEARRKLSEIYLLTGQVANAAGEAIRAADLLPNDANAQLLAGQLLLAARMFPDAQARADKALAIAPQMVEAQLLRANALAGLRKLDDAVEEVEEAIRTDPDRAMTYAKLGSMQSLKGDKPAAEAAFRKAVQLAPQSVDPRLGLAGFLWAAGRLTEAETELKSALELDPKNLMANRALALYFLGSGRPQLAEPFLVVIADSATEGGQGKLMLADYYAASQRRSEAIKILQDLAQGGGAGAVPAKIRLAGLDLRSGNIAHASELIEEVLSVEPRNVNALLTKAALLARPGSLDQALSIAESAVQINPRSVAAQFALGRLHQSLRHDDEAMAAFNEALRLNPSLAQAELELARIHLRRQELDDAEKFARAAMTKAPGYSDPLIVMAQVNIRQRRIALAEPIIAALAKALPQSLQVRTLDGQLALLKGDRPRARRSFQQVLDHDAAAIEALAGLVDIDLREQRPAAARARVDAAVAKQGGNSDVLFLAGRTAFATGDAQEAKRLAQAAVEADPNNFDAYTFLGALYRASGEFGPAIALYQNAAARAPKAIGPPTMLGLLYQLQDKKAEATASYERALDLDSHAAVAANNLAWMYLEMNTNLDRALELAKVAKAGLPDRSDVDDTLGWAYYKKRDFNSALPPLMSAVQKNPKVPGYQYRLGLVYQARDETSKAAAALEAALAIDPAFAEAGDARRVLAELKR